ncbi:MAG TPA: hypothetical protein VN154_10065 [Rhizomicrobium sp.]|nr:hypothetical protein [Rhizomicrobium sp.]
MKRTLTSAGMAIGLLLSSHCDADDEEERFVDSYRCAILHQLDEIHFRRSRYEENRFVVIEPLESPLGYAQNFVQCASDNTDQMLCEAASGYYMEPRTHLSRESVASLARLGFSTDDSHGNFQRQLRVPDESSRAAIGEMLLRALYEAYGIRIGHHLRVTAPLLGEDRAPLAPQSCAMIS